jgi:hypothetical protein
MRIVTLHIIKNTLLISLSYMRPVGPDTKHCVMRFFIGKVIKRDNCGVRDVGGRIVLKLISGNNFWKCGINLSCPGLGQMFL